MALLAALCALSKSHNFNFSVFHVEHGLRPPDESLGDAGFVLDFCRQNGIECKIKHIPRGKIALFAKKKGTGIEAAARYFRHRALRSEATRQIKQENGESLSDCSNDQDRKKAVILFAHTKDDLLETTLMRILCGAGPAGLSAMRPRIREQRSETRDRRTIEIARPILKMTRADVINYLNAKNILWREDSTNNDEKFLRNRIRRSLTPFLTETFPQWKKGIAALGETQSLVSGFLSGEAKKRIKWERDFLPQYVSANEEKFFAQPEIIREEAVFYGIDIMAFGKKILSKSVKRSVVRKFCEGSINAADFGFTRIRRENGKIFLSCKQKDVFERGISRLTED